MTVANPREVPEYELNPLELQVRKSDGITKVWFSSLPFIGLMFLEAHGSYQVARWNGTKVAVKILDKDSYSDPETIALTQNYIHISSLNRNAFKHELTLLEKVRHPNVVQFVGAVTQNIPMMIVSEYHSKGDLGSYLQRKGRLSPSKVLRFALDIARHVAGFGLIRLSKISPDKAKLAQPNADVDPSNIYMAPEIYKNVIFDRSVDAYSFGIMLYEMIEGVVPFHPKPAEEAVKLMCLEGKRPPFKTKSRSYPPDLRELVENCWDQEPVVRPIFAEIIVRLDKIIANCSKQGWWKDTFKLPWTDHTLDNANWMALELILALIKTLDA
ncbi:Serine-threonine/tyrosine-protein kinase [Theobroma cacao]|nr:Serine-threonine/tyrosine-protein kinase [Theobroma cacao]